MALWITGLLLSAAILIGHAPDAALALVLSKDGQNLSGGDMTMGRHILASEGAGTSGAMPAYHGPSLYTIWLYTIHGWLMSVAWGALAPAAILVAYKFKDLPSRGLWFQIHRAMMALAYIMQLVGVAVVSVPISWTGMLHYPRQTQIHYSVGLLVQALAFIQVLLAFVGRPSHGSHLRRTWNVAHWWMGRLLLLLGIVLVYDGLLLYRNGRKDQWKFISFSAYLFAIFLVAAGKDAMDETKLPPPAAATGLQPGKQSAIDLSKGHQAKVQPDTPTCSPRISTQPHV
ncbi:g1319 [Coccomyxa viridis]|uniref:G1319 protein n=1 Tax=Coccomyxa viridis TaxID=1274662 RepID=A0ABP1FHV2_9CHLO